MVNLNASELRQKMRKLASSIDTHAYCIQLDDKDNGMTVIQRDAMINVIKLMTEARNIIENI